MARAPITGYKRGRMAPLCGRTRFSVARLREYGTDLEQPHVALHVRKIVFHPPGERVDKTRSEIRLIFSQRIANAMTFLASAHEGHRPGFEKSCRDKPFPNAPSDAVHRRIGHSSRTESANLGGKSVVTVKAGDFLDELHLAGNVGPERRRGYEKLLSLAIHDEADTRQIHIDVRYCDLFAEYLRNTFRAKSYGARMYVWNVCIGWVANTHAARNARDQLHRVKQQVRNRSLVYSALEPVARISRDAKLASRSAHTLGVERCDLEQNVGGVI